VIFVILLSSLSNYFSTLCAIYQSNIEQWWMIDGLALNRDKFY